MNSPSSELFGSVCRCCRSQNGVQVFCTYKINITDKCHLIDDLFYYCTNIKREVDKCLPSRICYTCLQQLILLYIFKTKCEESNSYFLSCIQNKESTVNVNIDIKEEPFSTLLDDPLDNTNDSWSNNEEDNNDIVKFSYLSFEHSYCKQNNKVVNKKSFIDEFKKEIGIDESNDIRESTSYGKSNENKIKQGTIAEDNTGNVLKKILSDKKDNAEKTTSQVDGTPNKVFRLIRDRQTCEICNKVLADKRNLTIHMMIHKGIKNYKCQLCLKSFRRPHHLRGHMLTHSGIRPYECKVCKKRYSTKTVLKQHTRSHTGEKPYLCSVCGKGFALKHCLEIHARIHSGVKPLQCDICDRRFASYNSLISHKRVHTDDRPFLCTVCGKAFKCITTLRCHTSIHSGVKPFPCPHCDKTFRTKFLQVIHIRVHTGEKPFTCPICEKKYRTKSKMTCHMKTHSNDTRYSCVNCNEKFRTKGTLKIHIATHTDNNEHVCTTCQEKFEKSNFLKKHIKDKHIAPRRYKCKVCKSGFPNINELNIHSKSHTRHGSNLTKGHPKSRSVVLSGNKEHASSSTRKEDKQSNNRTTLHYKCKDCVASFNTSFELSIHSASHTSSKLYNCAGCAKGFDTSRELSKHLKVCAKYDETYTSGTENSSSDYDGESSD